MYYAYKTKHIKSREAQKFRTPTLNIIVRSWACENMPQTDNQKHLQNAGGLRGPPGKVAGLKTTAKES